MITIHEVGASNKDASALWEEQRLDLASRYDEPNFVLETEFVGFVGSLVGYAEDGEPIATVVLRWSPYHPAGVIELKRLYVRPDHRGNGHSRVIMGVAEAVARRVGATALALTTGVAQPEAIGLYLRTGYRSTPSYGDFGYEGTTRFYAKDLATRVLVINGSMGSGKTVTAAAIHDVMEQAGARVAFIDADYLCQASQPPEEDPYQQRLLFANLAAVAPVYRAHGYGCIVLARVVEDPEDRDRYAHAFAGPGGAGQVAVVRVTASDETRIQRVQDREPEGHWREWGVARTLELEQVLEDLDLDDAVVSTEGVSRLDVASNVLDAAGWWTPGREPLA